MSQKNRHQRYGVKICSWSMCDLPHAAKGLCASHYAAQREGRPLRPLHRWAVEQVFDHYSKYDVETGCWLWVGRRNPEGYGLISGWPGGTLAHRYAYTYMHGPIGDGLVIDHLCRNRPCVNPYHMEAVTFAENVARGAAPGQALWRPPTHCVHGHEFTDENTYRPPGDPTQRMCRQCRTRRARERRARLREAMR